MKKIKTDLLKLYSQYSLQMITPIWNYRNCKFSKGKPKIKVIFFTNFFNETSTNIFVACI